MRQNAVLCGNGFKIISIKAYQYKPKQIPINPEHVPCYDLDLGGKPYGAARSIQCLKAGGCCFKSQAEPISLRGLMIIRAMRFTLFLLLINVSIMDVWESSKLLGKNIVQMMRSINRKQFHKWAGGHQRFNK